MKIELEVQPRTFWIQKANYAMGHAGYGKECEAKVVFEPVNGNEYSKYFYGTAEECVAFVREYFSWGSK